MTERRKQIQQEIEKRCGVPVLTEGASKRRRIVLVLPDTEEAESLAETSSNTV